MKRRNPLAQTLSSVALCGLVGFPVSALAAPTPAPPPPSESSPGAAPAPAPPPESPVSPATSGAVPVASPGTAPAEAAPSTPVTPSAEGPTPAAPSPAAPPAAASEPSPPPPPPPAPEPTPPLVELIGPTLPTKDATQNLSLEEKRLQSKEPFRGSIFLVDQSITTQTIGVGSTPQTYVPYYQLWLSFRPRYYITDHLLVSARLDYYKELTNSGSGDAGATTDYREDDFGDVWTNLVYEGFVDKNERTKLNAGLRFLWGLSKSSQGQGIPVQAGLTAGASHKVPIHDASAPFLNDVHFKAGAWYNHPFAENTTPANPNFQYVRQNTDGQSVVTSQLAGTPLVNHQLLLSAEAAVQITPRVDFALDLILINQWHYSAPASQCVATLTGPACPSSMNPGTSGNLTDTNYSELTWLIATLNWDALDQVSFGLGYFNLQNELSSEATNRNLGQLLWSPDARFFFDITANLDAIYDSVAPKKGALKEAAKRAREANFSQWTNGRL